MSVEDLQRTRGGNAVFGQRTGAPFQVESVEALKAVDVATAWDGISVILLGYVEAGDGGQGFFTYDATSVATENGGTVIAPDSGAGRWLRSEGNVLFARWFGASPAETDNTEAIVKAADAVNAAGGGILMFDAGVYRIASLAVFSEYDGVSFQGEGTTIKSTIPEDEPATGEAYMLRFDSCTNFRIRGIKFDGDNIETTQINTTMVALVACSNFSVEDCEIVNLKRFGLGLNSCTNFYVKENYFLRTTIENSYQNGSIRLFATLGTCGPGWIEDNDVHGAGIGYEGDDITYAFNRITNWGYGAGIVTNASATSNRATIIGNIISGGTGQDADGVYCSGIESYAAYSRIIGNLCKNNDGSGIAFGGKFTILHSNQCIDNGSADNPGVGIANNYQDATYNGSFSVLVGNICRQVTGAHQAYGFADIGSGNVSTSLSFTNNDFGGNATGEFLKAAGSVLYSWVGKRYQFSAAWNPGAILTKATVSMGVTAAGAQQGDFVEVSFSPAANDGLVYSGYIYGDNSAAAVITNPTSGTVTPASGTVYLSVTKKAPF